jgi:hypothetical protein
MVPAVTEDAPLFDDRDCVSGLRHPVAFGEAAESMGLSTRFCIGRSAPIFLNEPIYQMDRISTKIRIGRSQR